MRSIVVRDLKSGSGPTTAVGDTLELRYHVAASLELLDAGVLLQSNWSPGDPPIYATLGEGRLRAEIEAELIGVKVGTNRRFLVPPDTWADVDIFLAIGVDVGAIVPKRSAGDSEWSFDEMASAVPLAELDQVAELDARVRSLLLTAVPPGGRRRKRDERPHRLLIPHDLYPHVQALLYDRGVADKLRWAVHDVGTVKGGDYEVDIAGEDVSAWLRHMERED
jgi:hypothetical protein